MDGSIFSVFTRSGVAILAGLLLIIGLSGCAILSEAATEASGVVIPPIPLN